MKTLLKRIFLTITVITISNLSFQAPNHSIDNSLTLFNFAVAADECFGGDMCVVAPILEPIFTPCTDCGGSSGPGNGSGNQGSGTGNQGGGDSGSTPPIPADPPKSPRQKCLESNAVKHAICRATTTAKYAEKLSGVCVGQGNVTVGGGFPVLNGSVSVDEYNQCKNIAEANRNNALDVCDTFNEIAIESCP
jgi:hypothetical protein